MRLTIAAILIASAFALVLIGNRAEKKDKYYWIAGICALLGMMIAGGEG